MLMGKQESAKDYIKDTDYSGGLPTRMLGRTGERVSILCLGGWHIGAVKPEKEAFRIMHAAIDD